MCLVGFGLYVCSAPLKMKDKTRQDKNLAVHAFLTFQLHHCNVLFVVLSWKTAWKRLLDQKMVRQFLSNSI